MKETNEDLSKVNVGDIYTDSNNRAWKLTRLDNYGLRYEFVDFYATFYICFYLDSRGNIRISADGGSEDAINYAIRLWKHKNI